jgi:hypothetical protein
MLRTGQVIGRHSIIPRFQYSIFPSAGLRIERTILFLLPLPYWTKVQYAALPLYARNSSTQRE